MRVDREEALAGGQRLNDQDCLQDDGTLKTAEARPLFVLILFMVPLKTVERSSHYHLMGLMSFYYRNYTECPSAAVVDVHRDAGEKKKNSRN